MNVMEKVLLGVRNVFLFGYAQARARLPVPPNWLRR